MFVDYLRDLVETDEKTEQIRKELNLDGKLPNTKNSAYEHDYEYIVIKENITKGNQKIIKTS